MSRRAVDREHLERRPRLHRRVDVVERPLVRGERAVRVLEPLAAEQDQLVLREGRVDVRERDAVEGEVPRGEPRVLPLVRHRHDVEGVERAPARRCGRRAATRAAAAGSGRRRASGRRRSSRAACSRASRRAPGAGRAPRRRMRRGGRQLGVELVGLGLPAGDDRVEVGPRVGRRGRPAAAARAASPSRPARPSSRYQNAAFVPASVATVAAPRDDVVVDPVLRARRRRASRRAARRSSRSRRRAAPARRRRRARASPRNGWSVTIRAVAVGAQLGLLGALVPRPGVAVPRGRQDVQRVGLRARRS